MHAVASAPAIAATLGEPGTLAAPINVGLARVDHQGRVQVSIELEEVTDGALDALRHAGVEIEIYDTSGRVVEGWVSPMRVDRVAALPGVRLIDLPSYGVSNTGSVASQGDTVIRADQLRALGATGSGVKVGVLSDGISGLTSSIASGDLPASGVTMPAAPLTGGGISLDSPLPGGTVFTAAPEGRPDLTTGSEGRAMLEIIHDLAPGAQLFFAPAGTSLADRRAIRWLVAQGVKVIADDHVFFNAGPYNGTAAIAQEASSAVAAGASYFVSAGNFARRHYQGLFTDTDGDSFHEFDVSLGLPRVDNAGETLNVTLQPGETVTILLAWDDAFGASGNDFDLCVHDPADLPTSPLFCSQNVQSGTQNPTEALAVMRSASAPTPGTLGIRINRFGTVVPRVLELFLLFTGSGGMDEFIVPESSVPNKPDAGGGVIAVGAVSALTPTTIESFSSRGPTNDGRLKPEMVAPDGVVTSVPGFAPFFGTSAAVPHAAGLAALLLSRIPSLRPRQLERALEDATTDLGSLGADNTFGHGLLDGSVFTRIRSRLVWYRHVGRSTRSWGGR